MLEKSENPALFKLIWFEYAKNKEPFTLRFQVPESMTDEQLSEVRKLVIDTNSGSLYGDLSFETLNGLEKLPNLEEFSFSGVDAHMLWETARSIKMRAGAVGNYDVERDKKYQYDRFGKTQLKDISALSKCKNLKKLQLENQYWNNLGVLDISNSPMLKEIIVKNCTTINTVKGLDKVYCINDEARAMEIYGDKEYDNYVINFDGCSQLARVDGFDTIAHNLVNATSSLVGDVRISFPTTAFCSIGREYPNAIKELVAAHYDNIGWSENSTAGVRYVINSNQILMAKNRTREIIKTICTPEDSQIERVAKVYAWICENVTYDHEGLDREKDTTLADINKAKRLGERTYNTLVTNRTRSSYCALFHNKAVCVGISNLFNFMLSDLGVTAEPVICECAEGAQSDTVMTAANHQITKIHFVTGEAIYFDPTWDLGKEEFNYFALTRDELQSRFHSLTLIDEVEPLSESYQKALRDLGCLSAEIIHKDNVTTKVS